MTGTTRRQLLGGGLALAGGWLLSACTPQSTSRPTPAFTPPPQVKPTLAPGRAVVAKTLRAAPTTVDLGGVIVDTWAYEDSVPGPVIRATAGDLLQLGLDNQLPDDTTIHWHGVALPNAADGVPGMTQEATAPGQSYLYEFVAPDPGTYFFHPHVGVQLDRGLYTPLIIDDPREPGEYDAEWIVVIDDWLDGTGRTPDEAFDQLKSDGANGSGGGMGGMGGMDHSGMGDGPFGSVGDVEYPYYLINGAIPESPASFIGKPGQKVRIRIINASSDTLFTLAIGNHDFIVTHSDGFAVQPRQASALHIGMGERYDVTVTLGDGVFPLVAKPWGKNGQAMALLRTGSGGTPAATIDLQEFRGLTLQGADLTPDDSARLPERQVGAVAPLRLGGRMRPYIWTINGERFGQNSPIEVAAGQRLRLDVTNASMMTHPMHVHGHTFALPNGLRKDTVLVPPMGRMRLYLDANNPGAWAVHCHNIYHAEAGMMIALQYS